MKNAGFFILILFVVNVSGVPLDVAADLKSDNVFKIKPRFIQSGGNQASLSGVLFKTVVKYYCSIPLFNKGSVTILYGTKGWTFPQQDVNLTLSYPTTDTETRFNFDHYRISGYEVLLFTDGSESTGVITSGGLLQDHITLNFTMSGITQLSYEFWLYGLPGAMKGGIPGPHQNNNFISADPAVRKTRMVVPSTRRKPHTGVSFRRCINKTTRRVRDNWVPGDPVHRRCAGLCLH